MGFSGALVINLQVDTFNLAKVAAWELLAAVGMDQNARQELIR